MMEIFEREISLIGENAFYKLKRSRILILGLGGVGSYAAEALVRCGVGHVSAIDADTVAPSNINRQLFALTDTVGKKKTDLFKERAHLINPDADIAVYDIFYDEHTADRVNFSEFDYVIDCIDTVSSKILAVKRCVFANVPIISCMGTGNKLSPSRFKIADIKKTSVCPLARVMRKKLKDEGITSLTVLYSDEPPVKTGERVPASISFVPPVAGYMLAGHVINSIIKATS